MRPLRVGLTIAALSASTGACAGSSDGAVGERTVSGVVRLTEDSFGLLVYPCVTEAAVAEVVLLEVELDPDGLEVVSSRALLRERFPDPLSPNEFIVSTALDANPAVAGAEREILNAELLERFNTDETYLTDVELIPRFLTLDAFDADGNDVSGTGSLRTRFTADVGETAGFTPEPIAFSDMYCPGREPPAWSIPLP